MAGPYHILANSFLEALRINTPTTDKFKVLSEIALEKTINVTASGLWIAFLRHSWDTEKMAQALLEDTFGALQTAQQLNAPANIQFGQDQRGLGLATMLLSNKPILKRLTAATTALLSDFLLPIKNPSFNEITPKGFKQASRGNGYRHNILQRDRYQCPITDKFDRDALQFALVPNPNPVLGAPAFLRLNPLLTHPCLLQAAHILPHSLAYHTAAHKYIEWFTGGAITAQSIAGEAINSDGNGLSLQADAHKDFDDFLWGIEEVVAGGVTAFRAVRIGDDNCSVVCGRDIVFRNTIPALTVPNPLHFRLHLSVGRMLHDSGAL